MNKTTVMKKPVVQPSIEELKIRSEKLLSVLRWIGSYDPEVLSAAENRFDISLYDPTLCTPNITDVARFAASLGYAVVPEEPEESVADAIIGTPGAATYRGGQAWVSFSQFDKLYKGIVANARVEV